MSPIVKKKKKDKKKPPRQVPTVLNILGITTLTVFMLHKNGGFMNIDSLCDLLKLMFSKSCHEKLDKVTSLHSIKKQIKKDCRTEIFIKTDGILISLSAGH